VKTPVFWRVEGECSYACAFQGIAQYSNQFRYKELNMTFMMSPMAFFTGQPGPVEIILILAVILLFFGARRLPELSRSLGRSLSEFKRGRREGALDESSDKDEADHSEEKPV
jgi:sec-independent protein translocase protein TatA